jgi:hypothetical protein
MWTYSGDPSGSDIDAIRFYVQDTDPQDMLITDEEIDFLIGQWTPVYGNNLMVASMVAEAIAAKFTREVAYSADGVSVGVQELQQKYNDLASSLRDQYKQYDIGSGPVVGGILFSDVKDPSIKPTLWSVGMHDNARAGNQDDLTSTYQNFEQGGESGVPG